MYYDYENMTELIGSLTALNGGGTIEDVNLELDKQSAKKLADVLKTGRVTRENQDLFFKSIIIPMNQLELFTRGQSSWVKTEKGYSLTSAPLHRVRFKGDFQTLIHASDGYDYAFDVKMGGIEFDIGDKPATIVDNEAVLNNVNAIIFPVGTYKAEKIEE